MAGGQPSKLTKQTIREIALFVPRVMYLETLGELLGVSRYTWRNWLKIGQLAKEEWERNSAAKLTAHQELCIEFFDTYKKAIAESVAECLRHIRNSKQWQAHAWILERVAPEKWGRHRREYAALRRQMVGLEREGARLQAVQHGGAMAKGEVPGP